MQVWGTCGGGGVILAMGEPFAPIALAKPDSISLKLDRVSEHLSCCQSSLASPFTMLLLPDTCHKGSPQLTKQLECVEGNLNVLKG